MILGTRLTMREILQ